MNLKTLMLFCGLAISANAQNFYGSYTVAGETGATNPTLAGQTAIASAPDSIAFLGWDGTVVTFFVYSLPMQRSVYNSGSCVSQAPFPSPVTPGQSFSLSFNCSGVGASDGLPYHLMASVRMLTRSDGTYQATRGSVTLDAH
jgi:hypothetical protein